VNVLAGLAGCNVHVLSVYHMWVVKRFAVKCTITRDAICGSI